MIVTGQYLNDQVVASLVQNITSGGAQGPLYGKTLVLFQNNFPLNNQVVFASLVEATYSGYARKVSVAFSAPILQNDGSYTMVSALQTFVASSGSPFAGNMIFGWALIDSASPPNVLIAEIFAAPQPVGVPNQGFTLAISVNFGQPNALSAGTVIA